MTELLEKQPQSLPKTEADDIGQYLSDIRSYPRLTVQEERELAKGCAEGDEEAIRRMVNSNLRLVVSVAREYAGRGIPLLDLIQEGSIGLIVAAKKFDYTLDYRFSTYATKWIRQGISRYLINHSGVIRVPTHTAEKIRRILSVRANAMQQGGIEPTVGELAQMVGLSTAKVTELLALEPEVCSLDAYTGDEEKSTLGMLLEDQDAAQPQEALIRRELEQILHELLSMLSDRQRQILTLHFGLEDGKCCSLEEIGRRLGVSKERVRQIERQAMDKLQALGASMGLEDFLE